MDCSRIFLLTLIFTIILIFSCAAATTITVCESGCNNTSIKSALDKSQPGDIIEVHGGIYDGNLNIRKSISLVGIPDERGMPLINGSGYGSVVTIAFDGVNITGFKLTGSGDCACGDSGIRINSNNNTIYGNNITGNHYGVNIKVNATGNKIFGNSFINNSVNARDNGKSQWYGLPPSKGDILRLIIGYLGLAKKGYIGNYYDDYSKEEVGKECTARDNICEMPYNITGKGNNSDPYPLASRRS